MISLEDYKLIIPHRVVILKCRQTGCYKGGDVLILADKLRQRYGCGPPINYACNGCKIEAMNDLYHLMN